MKAIDLFAGWGGFTEGAEAAGIEVVYAANHWPLAVEAHAKNHPGVRHECQDLRQADWSKLPAYDLLLASPACQGHSTASQPGRRAYHDALRATAWAVVDCADVTEPKAILVENVPAFKAWRLFPQWKASLETLGYHVTEETIDARWHGVPQRRKRLFIAATRKPGFRFARPSGAIVEPAFGPCIEWGAGRWRPIAGAREDARARMLAARTKHGPRFLSQHTTGHPGVSLDESIRTITTKDQWVIVDGDSYRPLTVREYARAMGFRDGYSWPDTATRIDTIKGLGNAVSPPVAEARAREVAEAA